MTPLKEAAEEAGPPRDWRPGHPQAVGSGEHDTESPQLRTLEYTSSEHCTHSVCPPWPWTHDQERGEFEAAAGDP